MIFFITIGGADIHMYYRFGKNKYTVYPKKVVILMPEELTAAELELELEGRKSVTNAIKNEDIEHFEANY